MIKVKHPTCEKHPVQVNWSRTDSNGNPALECQICPGRRGHKRKYICWLTKREAQLWEEMELDYE